MDLDRRSFGKFLFGISSVSLTSPESVLAASYPEKPIIFICPWPAGGRQIKRCGRFAQQACKRFGASHRG
jgi:tripartite-type tricarboxylate transporter receptor subunit TctC